MNACAAAGAAFLVAVLWFDLMFDVQTRGHAGEALPAEVLASIAAYYRRVTTEASPMSRLIPVVMGLTVLALVVELVRSQARAWPAWVCLILALGAIGLAMARTVRSAVRLGGARDEPAIQTGLARTIYRDHLCCLAAMVGVVGLQLGAGF
jgi:hypothetical protein